MVEIIGTTRTGHVKIGYPDDEFDTLEPSALHPLPPTMSAEDAAVLEAADRMVTRDGKMVCIPKSPGPATFHENDLAGAIVARRAAVRSRAAKQEVKVETPKFKVGDRVRYTVEGSWAHGKVATITRADIDAALMRFDGHGEAYALFSEIVLASNPDPSLHADGDDREAEVVDRADEEGRRVVGLERAVVEAAPKILNGLDWNIAVDAITDEAGVWEFRNAVHALRAALTPPAPVDPVAELREAGATLVTEAKKFRADTKWTRPIDDAIRATEAALAALARAP